ncbi:MAG: hypothetical protein ACI8PZ_002355 [Myxococcota bacterium]|jgi:hypothetical protein
MPPGTVGEKLAPPAPSSGMVPALRMPARPVHFVDAAGVADVLAVYPQAPVDSAAVLDGLGVPRASA